MMHSVISVQKKELLILDSTVLKGWLTVTIPFVFIGAQCQMVVLVVVHKFNC